MGLLQRAQFRVGVICFARAFRQGALYDEAACILIVVAPRFAGVYGGDDQHDAFARVGNQGAVCVGVAEIVFCRLLSW